MGVISSIAYHYLTQHGGSYEFKDEMAYRCEKAVLTHDLSHLYGEMKIFKPDDLTLETYTAENVETYIKTTQLDSFVKDLSNL